MRGIIHKSDDQERYQSRSCCDWISAFMSRLGPEERREPMVMDARERGEYSAERLVSEEEYGDGGNWSEGWDDSYIAE